MIFSAAEWAALALSFKVSLCASLFSLPFAIALAWVLARTHFWGKSIVSALVHLPLVLPPVVTGYGLLLVFGRQGVIGGFLDTHFGLILAFRWTGAALAAAIMGFPLMVRVIQLAIEALDPKLEEAAKTLGAGWGARFALIVLPLIAPGILAGGILGFAKAMGEFGATITFVANIPGQTQTLPSAIYAFLQVPGGEASALRLVTLSVIVALGAVFISDWLGRQVANRIREK